MEEEKAAAYYDELSRKGEAAARFKQGLGFSSSSNSDPFPSNPKTSSSSSSALFSNFVRASSPTAKPPDEQQRKQARIEIIQNKLKKDHRHNDRRRSPSPSPHRDRRRRSSRDRDDRRSGDRRHRSPSQERRRESDGRGSSHRRHRSRDRDEDSPYSRSRRRSRSRSPCRDSRGGDRERRGGHEKETGGEKHRSSRNKSGADVDYSQLIEGYSKMTPAERVKAKMKLQLSETVAKDTDRGMGSGWERFDFNKEAPLDDDDDEIEVADDDVSLVKDIGKSFRFSAVEAKREEEIKAAHDNAMFGASAKINSAHDNAMFGGSAAHDNAIFGASAPSPVIEMDNGTEDATEKIMDDALISDKVIAMQQSSWRDRARKFRNDSES